MNLVIVSIVLGVGFAVTACGWIVTLLRSRGVNVQSGVDTAQRVLDVADTVTDAAAAIVPSPVTSALQKIVDAAKIGVNSAEQLYCNGSIAADQRKTEAEKVLKTALGLDGIAYEGDVASLGDSAMEAAVKALPKTGTKEAVVGTAQATV
ncbi:MAG: hypothetical protein E7572_11815 [Ruminococcaceae bacterium]|jgi:hypothetical protein|nr:hypothetical protein [Oscillospiraceae bacterium]